MRQKSLNLPHWSERVPVIVYWIAGLAISWVLVAGLAVACWDLWSFVVGH